ncbi:MAG: carboxypeptidase-like regulatory domain-containing protein [Acidobacteriota bacterium]
MAGGDSTHCRNQPVILPQRLFLENLSPLSASRLSCLLSRNPHKEIWKNQARRRNVFIRSIRASGVVSAGTYRSDVGGIVRNVTRPSLPGRQRPLHRWRRVTLTNTATNLARKVVTDANGLYVVPEIAAGRLPH